MDDVELSPFVIDDPHPFGSEPSDGQCRLADRLGDVSEAKAARDLTTHIDDEPESRRLGSDLCLDLGHA